MYRKGAVGALLDIYEKAIAQLKNTIEHIPDGQLARVVDANTEDDNCRSYQSILSHVVYSGFGYAASMHNLKGPTLIRAERKLHNSTATYLADLDQVFAYTEKIFANIQDEELEQLNQTLKIKTGWQQLYDIEQLMEHAIVHILRHQRQIEKFESIRLNNTDGAGTGLAE